MLSDQVPEAFPDRKKKYPGKEEEAKVVTKLPVEIAYFVTEPD